MHSWLHAPRASGYEQRLIQRVQGRIDPAHHRRPRERLDQDLRADDRPPFSNTSATHCMPPRRSTRSTASSQQRTSVATSIDMDFEQDPLPTPSKSQSLPASHPEQWDDAMVSSESDDAMDDTVPIPSSMHAENGASTQESQASQGARKKARHHAGNKGKMAHYGKRGYHPGGAMGDASKSDGYYFHIGFLTGIVDIDGTGFNTDLDFPEDDDFSDIHGFKLAKPIVQQASSLASQSQGPSQSVILDA